MSRLDELPPDQRAALSLLLARRKRYAEVAQLLGIPERAVHDRAHAALAVLAPRQARALAPERREQLGDHLLHQRAGAAERLRTRAYLLGSRPARAWARAVAGEIAPLAAAVPTAAAPAPPPPGASAPPPGASAPPPGTPTAADSGSRLGGALLLAAIVAAIVVAVVLIASGGGSKSASSTSKSSSTATGKSSTSASKSGPSVSAELPLHAATPGGSTVGLVVVLSEKSKRAFYIEAQHLPESHGFYYAIWLYNSPTSALALSRSPSVGSSHRLSGGALLPASAGRYREILLTRETEARPTSPGPIVLRGAFKLKT